MCECGEGGLMLQEKHLLCQSEFPEARAAIISPSLHFLFPSVSVKQQQWQLLSVLEQWGWVLVPEKNHTEDPGREKAVNSRDYCILLSPLCVWLSLSDTYLSLACLSFSQALIHFLHLSLQKQKSNMPIAHLLELWKRIEVEPMETEVSIKAVIM